MITFTLLIITFIVFAVFTVVTVGALGGGCLIVIADFVVFGLIVGGIIKLGKKLKRE